MCRRLLTDVFFCNVVTTSWYGWTTSRLKNNYLTTWSRRCVLLGSLERTDLLTRIYKVCFSFENNYSRKERDEIFLTQFSKLQKSRILAHWWEQNIFRSFTTPQAFWKSSAPGALSTLVTSVVLYSLTRATLMSPEKFETLVCGYIRSECIHWALWRTLMRI